MIGAAAGAVAAGAWLGPGLALLAGFALQIAAGAAGEFVALMIVVGVSLLAGAPAALVAVSRGMALPALGLGCAAAAAASLGVFFGLDGLPLVQAVQAVPAAAASAALVLLWVGLAVGAGFGVPPLVGLAAGLGLGLLLAFGLGGAAGAFWGLGLGAAVAGLPAAVPAVAAIRRGRSLSAGHLAGSVLAGLALALAALAGPLAAYLLDGPLMALALALLVALPGLALVCLARGWMPFRLAIWLLGLQALAVVLGLAIGAAPAAAGLIMPQGVDSFRMALLGAGFLPAFAALQAVLLGRARLGPAIGVALLLALVAGGVPLLAAPWLDGLPPDLLQSIFGWSALAAPLLATFAAFLLVARRPGDHLVAKSPGEAG